MPLIAPSIDSAVLATLQEALFADEQVDVDYRSMNSEVATKRRLHPLAMVNRGALTYLIANPFENDDVRLYALHRIQKATRTYEAAKRPSDFDLDEYISAGGMHFGDGKTIRLNAWISPYLSKILEETPLSEDQRLQVEDDNIKLTATVADSWQLTWWIMSYGASIEVTAPIGLRRKIGGFLADAAAQYYE